MTLGILAFAEGPLSSTGKQDAIAVVTGEDINLTLGAEVVTAGATVVETGEDINLTLGDESVTATATVVVSGEEITSTAAGTVCASFVNIPVTTLCPSCTA